MAADHTENQLSYLAGFFDGEGCICVQKAHATSYYLLTVSVSNTRREVLEIYRDHFGGSIVKTRRAINHKDAYVWKVEANRAETFLLAMRGRLVIKRQQLELAIWFRQLFKGQYRLPRGNSDRDLPAHALKRKTVFVLRHAAYLEMGRLNKRGVDVANATASRH